MRPEALSLGDQSRDDPLLPSSPWMSLQNHPGTDPEAPLDCEMPLEKPSQKAQTHHVGGSALTRASRVGTQRLNNGRGEVFQGGEEGGVLS